MNKDFEFTHKNFIGIYRNVYPEGYCSHMISEFKRLQDAGAGHNRQDGEGALRHVKNDWSIAYGSHKTKVGFNDEDPELVFFQGLQRCFDTYEEEFSVLKSQNIRALHTKMQKTSPGGGYHVFHCEQAAGADASRVLVYLLYLNTLEEHEGGETEFLYQKTRVRPVENTMVIWPASFTHTHRGNTVLCDKDKYVMTGWFNYVE